MKKRTLHITTLIASVIILGISSVQSNQFGANPGATGAPGDFYNPNACGTAGCHSVLPKKGDTALKITLLDAATSQEVNSYHINRKYIVRVELTKSYLKAAGFESTVENSANAYSGSIAPKLKCQYSDPQHDYVTHLSSYTSTPGYCKWEYYWTSPATNEGNITIYAAGNAANNDHTSYGDSISLNTKVLPYLDATGIENTGENFDLTCYPDPVQNQLNISFGNLKNNITGISLYNYRGELVKNIFNRETGSGTQNIQTDLTGLPTGIYFIRIQNGASVLTRKLMKI